MFFFIISYTKTVVNFLSTIVVWTLVRYLLVLFVIVFDNYMLYTYTIFIQGACSNTCKRISKEDFLTYTLHRNIEIIALSGGLRGLAVKVSD